MFYGEATNIYSEAKALLQGLEKCFIEGFIQVDDDSDSGVKTFDCCSLGH